MTGPVRIQRKRTRGWRMPAGAVYVGRPSKWGNPFPTKGEWIVWAAVAAGFRADLAGRTAAAVALYRQWLLDTPARGPHAGDESGGYLEFEGGVTRSVAAHARGIALTVTDFASDRPVPGARPTLADIRAALAGRDLVCWCPPDMPCHADVLLELANLEVRP